MIEHASVSNRLCFSASARSHPLCHVDMIDSDPSDPLPVSEQLVTMAIAVSQDVRKYMSLFEWHDGALVQAMRDGTEDTAFTHHSWLLVEE